MPRRRVRALTAATLALLLPLAACGSSGGDKASDGSSKSSSDGGSGGGSGKGGTAADLPDPCKLVSADKASEILGGQAAKPTSTKNDAGMATRTCSWELQSSIDDPSLETAGHVLTLTVVFPPSSMTMEQYFDAAKSGSTKGPDICDGSFFQGGMLSARQGDIFLSGSAGLADKSPKAKQAVTDLLTAACASI